MHTLLSITIAIIVLQIIYGDKRSLQADSAFQLEEKRPLTVVEPLCCNKSEKGIFNFLQNLPPDILNEQ